MYQNYPTKVNPTPTSAPISGSYPIHPDVKFKTLPFYDLLAELLKPSSLSKCKLTFMDPNKLQEK